MRGVLPSGSNAEGNPFTSLNMARARAVRSVRAVGRRPRLVAAATAA